MERIKNDPKYGIDSEGSYVELGGKKWREPSRWHNKYFIAMTQNELSEEAYIEIVKNDELREMRDTNSKLGDTIITNLDSHIENIAGTCVVIKPHCDLVISNGTREMMVDPINACRLAMVELGMAGMDYKLAVASEDMSGYDYSYDLVALGHTFKVYNTVDMSEMFEARDEIRYSASYRHRDVLSWDEYFVSIAEIASKRSKDPNTKVGAVIVRGDNTIVSTGYNGLPSGMSDEDFDWGDRDNKYPYVVHAEQNALSFSRENLSGCKIYVTLLPCSTCAKLIVQSGIEEVVYTDDKYNSTEDGKASIEIMKGIQLRKVSPISIKLFR